MKEKVKLYGSILIIVMFIPYLLTVYLHGSRFQLFSKSNSDEQFEAQIVGILASEIPADYEMECLKAQAVIARTNLYREEREFVDETGGSQDAAEYGNKAETADSEAAGNNDKAENPEQDGVAETGWTEEQMRAAWGEDYERNLEKLETAVSETEGWILTYKKEPILAAYHTACNGKTREAADVPGQEAYTYLASAESPDDILADGFLYIGYMEKTDFANALQALFSSETINAEELPDSLQIAERDGSDYVTKVQYGATIVNGEAVRTALGLQSACFYLSELEGKIRIVTKGIGHGLGFSQYGAEQLAKKGYDWEELLEYYYQDVETERISK